MLTYTLEYDIAVFVLKRDVKLNQPTDTPRL